MNTPGKPCVGKWGYSITASDLTDDLEVLSIERGSAGALRMASGPEFISKAPQSWARKVDSVFIPPGRPRCNEFITPLNGRLRNE